ncbi:MAG: sigma-70 family RNA polymerase sigma factor [Clostridia bacterium]|nr:sigma-70 family RNA polymerase sigma factor [Clostridia bacterium]MDD4049117.1 sigma-70 family RNA polymerase sigma factor [Clostridia bacterium]
MISSQDITVDEKELIARVKANKQVFVEIYDAHFHKIYKYIYYRTYNQADAEEITSKTFLLALENIENYEYRNIPIAVWLYRIASNAVIDFYRKNKQTLELDKIKNIEASEPSPEAIMLSKSEGEQLICCMSKLPATQQQALVLRYRQNMTCREMSEVMDKTEGSIKQLLHRGLINLRERMVAYE